jgi:hypothetical protein
MESLDRLSALTIYDCDLLVSVVHRCFKLWLWWVLAAIVGGMLSLLVWQTMTGFVGGRLGWRTLGDVGGGTLSLFIGFIPLFTAQALVLRRHFPHMNLWVLGSAVGICLGAYAQRAVIFVLEMAPATTSGVDPQALGLLFSTQFWERVLGLFVLWAVVGATQWLIFRHRVRHAGWWVLASALAGAASGTVALVIVSANGDLLLSYLARWAIYGALTGIVLVLLLQNRIKHRLQQRIEWSRRVSTYRPR